MLAIGNGELGRNSICGAGVIPAGGIVINPVANINTSSRETAVCFSVEEKNLHNVRLHDKIY